MIFAGGKILPDTELNPVLGCLEEETAQTLSGPPLETETVLNALDALVRELDSGALDDLIAQYAPPGAREELTRVRPQISRAALEERLALELGGLAGPRPFGRSQVRPLGVLLHIAPGNMPGLPVYTALEGLLTGNINLIKLPHGDKGLSLAAFQLLTEQEPRLAPYLYAFDLSSGQREELDALAALADGLVAWGGDGAIEAARTLAGPGCKLIEWGHRLSFAYVSGYEDREGELLLKELLPGETVYQLVLRGAVEPWHWAQVRALSQSLRGAGLNLDWFPTNFIGREGILYYVDYECNPYMDQWSFESWGVRYWSRTPEFDAYAKEHGDS